MPVTFFFNPWLEIDWALGSPGLLSKQRRRGWLAVAACLHAGSSDRCLLLPAMLPLTGLQSVTPDIIKVGSFLSVIFRARQSVVGQPVKVPAVALGHLVRGVKAAPPPPASLLILFLMGWTLQLLVGLDIKLSASYPDTCVLLRRQMPTDGLTYVSVVCIYVLVCCSY